MSKKFSPHPAFTLLELVIVVIIIAVLAALGIPQFQKVIWRSRYAEVFNTAGAIARAKETYYAEHGNYGEGAYPNIVDCQCGKNITGESVIERDLGITVSKKHWRFLVYPCTTNTRKRIAFSYDDGCSGGGYAGYYDYEGHYWAKGNPTTDCPSHENFIPPN